MKYMLLIYTDPAVAAAAADNADMDAWFRYTNDLVSAGHLVAGDPLEGPETATTVRQRDGKTLHTDGPFAETKEVLGGYYLIDVPTLDDALAYAAKMPSITYGSVEVRPLMAMPG